MQTQDDYFEATNTIFQIVSRITREVIFFDALAEKGSFVGPEQYQLLFERDDNAVFDIEENSVQIDLHTQDGINVVGSLYNNLNETTQRLFGVRFSTAPQVLGLENWDGGKMATARCQLCLVPADLDGPNMLKAFSQTHQIQCSFAIPIELSTELGNVVGATMCYERVFVTQKDPDFQAQIEMAETLRELDKKVEQLDAMCRMTNDYGPYLSLLK